ncbi:MAG TPA: TetR/AcrR family transcriptional regulator [Marmoricola sp.]|nr:TetR/AcrR family transcriptional regulator [Marmoricola sp.]
MSAADRRDKLVDAAIAVMSRDGVASTTTRAIVAEAGMQIGVFHYCFRSKDELIGEVARTINNRSFEAVGDVLARSSDPAELIRGCVDAYWQRIEQEPLEHLLIFELTHFALRQAGWDSAARAQRDSNVDAVRALLTEIAEKGSLTWRSPMDLLARYVLATIEGITFQWLVQRDEACAKELFAKLVEWLYDEAGLPPR